MKPLSFVFSFLFAFSLFSCKAQDHTAKGKKDVHDTARIFLYGSVRVKETSEPVEYVPYMLFKEKVPYTYKNAARVGASDKNGQYSVDITSLKDSTQTLVIRCKYIKHAQTEIVIAGKIKKSMQVDIIIVAGAGSFNTTYKIDKKTSALSLVKQASEVAPEQY